MRGFVPEKTIKPKILINIGATLDIPTGVPITGKKGETIINGGLGLLTAVVGMGNRFKSTVIHYMVMSAMNRLLSSGVTSATTYDTEINISFDTLSRFIDRFEYLDKERLFLDEYPLWSLTDKSCYLADEWTSILKEWLKEKEKEKKIPYQCFNNRGNVYEDLPITFTEIDSLSEFEASDTVSLQDKHQLGDSGTNVLFMKQGLSKAKFTMELPRLAMSYMNYFLMTAHVDKDFNIQVGPIQRPPEKKLQFLKLGDKIKGVSSKFFFLLWNVWYIAEAKPLINQSTKDCEYPIEGENDPLDLHLTKLVQLRGKTGPTGYTLELVVSQRYGVLEDLTEFNLIRNFNYYGLTGSKINYHLDLYPDVKLSRTKIRSKLLKDEKLRRALNITSELCQINHFWSNFSDLICTPKELYEDIKKLGYDWNILLNSRGWWVPEQYTHPVPFLSTMDLLKMRKGIYHPYWLEEDKKTIKKEYKHNVK